MASRPSDSYRAACQRWIRMLVPARRGDGFALDWTLRIVRIPPRGPHRFA